MPNRYNQGAEKAYKSGRAPEYNDAESVDEQKEKERMLREQIRREHGNNGVVDENVPVWMKEDYNIFAGNLRSVTRRLKNKS